MKEKIKKKMKILIVTHYFLPHIGGIEIVAYNQAKELVKKGHKVTIVSSKVGDEPEEEIMDGVKIRRVKAWNWFEKNYGIPYPIFSWKILKVMNEEAKNVDIIHVHDINYLTSFIATKKSKKYSKPLILTQHITFVNKGLITNTIQRIVKSVYGNYIIKSSDKIIVCNDQVKKWLNKPNKTSFLHNAVDTNLFKPTTKKEKLELKKKYNLPLNKPIILFVGRLVEKKGFDKLFEARDKSYLIIFAGGGEIPDNMKKENNVLFLGEMSQEKLSEIYKASDIFCLPSKNEGFPLTILEAMASGLPIITSNHLSYNKYLNKNHVKLINPTPKKIKETIEELLKDKKQLIQMQKYSINEAVNKFSWDKNVINLLEVYQK